MKGFIYGLICPIRNEIRYIGLTKKTPEKRLSQHLMESKYYKRKGKYLNKKHNWLNKLIEMNIEKEIKVVVLEEIEYGNNIDILSEREIYWISVYKNLSNSTDGGEGVLNLSEDARKRISITNSGEKNGMYGKRIKRTKEQKKKLSLSLKNSNKLKESRSSNEYRKKISNYRSKPVFLLNDKLEIVMEFKNSTICADYFGFTRGNIKNAISSLRKVGKSMKNKYWVIRKENYEESINKIREKINLYN
jgi:hypothetical protein